MSEQKNSFLYIRENGKADWGMPEGYPYKEPYIIEWDGNTDGKATFSLQEIPYYKVDEYNEVDLLNGIATLSGEAVPEKISEELTLDDTRDLMPGIIIYGNKNVMLPLVIKIQADLIATDLGDLIKGTYFLGADKEIIVTKVIGGEIVHPMSFEFLPTAVSVSYIHSNPTAADYNALLASLHAANYVGAIFPPWKQSNIISGKLYAAAYANNLWVIGTNKGLYYSDDGQTWKQSNITSGNFECVSYGNSIWVAGSRNGLCYSSDGKAWEQSNITSGTFVCVSYGNSMWVAGSPISSYYSSDGKAWTQSNNTSAGFHHISYANGLWVGLAYSGKGLYYSDDGQTWKQSNITSGNFECVSYANGMWVAGSHNGPYYSSDGKIWTKSDDTNERFKCITSDNALWVAGSYANKGLYYSDDGQTWKQSNITSGNFECVSYANGMWVAGNKNTGLYYSADSRTWEQSNMIYGNFYHVAYADGIWVAGSGNNSGVFYSK